MAEIVAGRRLVPSSWIRSARAAVTRLTWSPNTRRFSAKAATVVTSLVRSGVKPGTIPGMLKNVSVVNDTGLTVLTVDDNDSGKRVCVLALTSRPADQSVAKRPICPE